MFYIIRLQISRPFYIILIFFIISIFDSFHLRHFLGETGIFALFHSLTTFLSLQINE